MIDDIILAIEINDPAKVNKKDFRIKGSDSYKTVFIQNNEKGSKEFKPSLSYSQFAGNKPSVLTIKGSIAKWYNDGKNNLKEPQKSDLPSLVEKMIIDLERMGVNLTPEDILNAKPLRVDFSKNIILSLGSTFPAVVKRVSYSMLPRFKNTTKGFKNGGTQYTVDTDSVGVSLYDKKREMGEDFKSFVIPDMYPSQDILRIEIRLNSYRAIKCKLARAGIKKDNYTFQDLFDEDVSKKVINYFWNDIISNIPPIYELSNATDTYNSVEITPHLKDRLAYAQLTQMMSENRSEELKILLECHYSKKNTYNFLKGYEKHCSINAVIKPSDVLDDITKQLDEFVLITDVIDISDISKDK